MAKIDIISGFLGAGKTTLIKKLIKEVFAGQKVVLIENEFGEIGIDGGFLKDAGIEISHVASATGSGGTTAGLVLGTSLFLPQAKATGLGVDTDPFEEIVSELVKEAAGLVGQPVPTDMDSRFRMIYHVGAGYAIPNAEDTPYIEELARQEGILLDPVYTGKAWAKFLTLVKEGYFDGQEHIAFVHTGGAAALFAMDLG